VTAATLTAAGPAAIVLPGAPESARQARAVVRRELGGHPAAEAAVLCVSELAANAVCHSRSGLPGGTFTVSVRAGRDVVRIAVTDADGAAGPRLRHSRQPGTHGRGLAIVAALSQSWGCERAQGGRVTWCEFPASEIGFPAADLPAGAPSEDGTDEPAVLLARNVAGVP
jgi:serine/threonine-protein kinase RsbW